MLDSSTLNTFICDNVKILYSVTHVPILLGLLAFIIANVIILFKRFKSNKVVALSQSLSNSHEKKGFNTLAKNPAMLQQKSKYIRGARYVTDFNG